MLTTHTYFARALLASSVAAVTLLAAPAAEATIIVPLSMEQMAEESAVVVRGRVVQRQSAWDKEHRRIYTYSEIQVLENIHAVSAVPKSLIVRTLGGEVGTVGMKVSGTPKFEAGELVVLFLRVDPMDNKQFQVIGMSQGKYRLEKSTKGVWMAVPSVEGLAFAKQDGSGGMKIDVSFKHPAVMPLEKLRTRVKTAVAKAGITPGTQPSLPANPNTNPGSSGTDTVTAPSE